ncbi:MAG: hypothetical protein K6D91_05920 [Prevotella sp.]|nr:hypothetical protein [Prevotella sp.]
MSNTEEKALEKYPVKECVSYGPLPGASEPSKFDDNKPYRIGFIEGYHQAEKDLELTNEDVYDIWRIYNEVCAEGKILGSDETSQEVLKRFKDLKKEPIKFKQGDVLYIPKHDIWVVWDEYNDTVINFMDFKLFIGHRFDSSITVEDVHVASEQQRSQLIQMLREKISITDEKSLFADEIKSVLKIIEK